MNFISWVLVAGCRPLLKAVALFVGLAIISVGAGAAEQKVPFRSWMTLRTQNVVLQKLDFSCGAAAIATVATHYLRKPVSEDQALRIIRSRYTPEEWKKKKQDGLSMEDLVYMAEQLGFSAEGARIGLAGLLKLSGPVIVHLNKGEFQHFSVLRGIHGMTVYLADPITGSVPMSLGMFLEQFTGVALAIWDPAKPMPSEHVLKLGEQDTFHDDAFNAMRSSLYGHDRLRSVRPAF